ncbi:MAG TPA: hypothetical protein VFL94_06750 [Actinomycetales bacterium]|nr:hypothetical protein [Actinomycetales bacterium]
MRRVPSAARDDRGQVSSEYLGVIAVVTVVVMTIATLSTGFGQQIGQGIAAAICRITGGSCSVQPVDLEATLPDCEIYSEDYDVKADVTVFSVNLGGNGKLALRKVVDAQGETKYLVDQQVGANLGAHVMFGEEGKFGLGEGLAAQVKGGLTGTGSRTYQFDNEKDARDFIAASAMEPGKQIVAHSVPLFGGLVKKGLDKITGTEYSTPASGVKEYYIEAGTSYDASASASAGIEAEVGTTGMQVLGVKVEPGHGKTQDKQTVYIKANRDLMGSLGILGQGPSGELKGEGVIGITLQGGRAVEASIEVAGTVKSSLLSGSDTGDIPLGNGLPKGSGTIGLEGGGTAQGKVTLTLDLTVPQNRTAFADALNSVGLPVMPDAGTPGYQDPVTATAALVDRFTTAGPAGGASLTAQAYEGSEASFTVGFFAGDLITFGAGGEVGTSASTATTSLYYDPARGMVPWKRCGG